jgi:hypothetical protein
LGTKIKTGGWRANVLKIIQKQGIEEQNASEAPKSLATEGRAVL